MSRIFSYDDTIAAIATPLGPGGIGIVRVSGPSATQIYHRIFRQAHPTRRVTSHRLTYGWVFDPSTGKDVDEAMAVLMKSPASYTREDVLEIQCHSSPALLHKVLEVCLANGARLAEPGEFTRRAFLNGRIDLSQAEAVLEITTARAELAGRLALGHLKGFFSREVEGLRRQLLDVLASVEVAIDYPEEDMEILGEARLIEVLESCIRPRILNLIKAYGRGKVAREGIEVLIVGRPNVGKSSLLNAMACEDKAIVTPVPGTTRDLIEAEIDMEGLAVRLVDTAGIRTDPDPVERLGIKKIEERLHGAAVVLWVMDISTPVDAEDLSVGKALSPLQEEKVLIVFNKADLIDQNPEAVAQERMKTIREGLNRIKRYSYLCLSAKKGLSLDRLSQAIRQGVMSDHSEVELEIAPNLRQKRALDEALRSIDRACNALDQGLSPDLISIDLKDAILALEGVTGEDVTEEVLDRIFSNFCLGK